SALTELLSDVLFDLLSDADSLAATDWLLEIDCDFATLADRLNDVDFSALTELLSDVLFDLLSDADSLAATDWLLEIDCDFATLADRLNDVDFSAPV
ncbi:hypothetical protein CYJ00_001140, partial [Staphylococcus pseudintermedius]